MYLVSHPDDLRYVLQSHPSEFRALDVPGSRDFMRVVRNSVVNLHEEDGWTRRIRLIGPEFNEQLVVPKTPEMVETTLATLAEFEGDDGGATRADPGAVPESVQVRAPDHDGVRLLPAMQRLTLRLLGVSLFGPDIRAQETEIIESVDGLRDLFKQRQTRLVASYVGRRLPDELHLPTFLQEGLGADPTIELGSRQDARIEAYVDQLVGAADAIVERRLRTPRAYDDALGTWLCRRDPVDGESLDPATLRQEVLGLLIAGHATVTAGMTWACYLLAARPEVQERAPTSPTGTRSSGTTRGRSTRRGSNPRRSPAATNSPTSRSRRADTPASARPSPPRRPSPRWPRSARPTGSSSPVHTTSPPTSSTPTRHPTSNWTRPSTSSLTATCAFGSPRWSSSCRRYPGNPRNNPAMGPSHRI